MQGDLQNQNLTLHSVKLLIRWLNFRIILEILKRICKARINLDWILKCVMSAKTNWQTNNTYLLNLISLRFLVSAITTHNAKIKTIN